jgi:hypothetical protein
MSIILASTDEIKIKTETTTLIDVYASYIDLNISTEATTLLRTNTAITTATTTTIVSSPDSGKIRKIKSIRIRNKGSYTDGYGKDGYVIVQHVISGGATIELYNDNLGPGRSVFINDSGLSTVLASGGDSVPSYYGVIAGAFGQGDPNELLSACQTHGVVSATPTQISTSKGRSCFFRLPFNLTVNKIRFYGVGDTTTIYHAAIYRYSDLARLTDDFNFSTAANTWGSFGDNIGLSLTAGTLYFISCSVDSTGTTAGILCMGPSVSTEASGQLPDAPQNWPASLDADNDYNNFQLFDIGASTGALPDPAVPSTLGAWASGMPAFWLDSNNS